MWLIGMMGSGKTSVGRLSAETLGVPFYDTDAVVAEKTGMTVAALWQERGEAVFRELERAAVETKPAGVLAAAGGGAVLDAASRRVMRRSPPVVWLRASPDTLARRLEGSEDRPLLVEAVPGDVELRRILERRRAAYEEVATHAIETDDRSIDDVVEDVIGLWAG